MAVRLSALRAGRPLTPRKVPGTHYMNSLCFLAFAVFLQTRRHGSEAVTVTGAPPQRIDNVMHVEYNETRA
jgi:hypothetical protein